LNQVIQLILQKAKVAVCSYIHTKHKYTLGQNVEFLSAARDGTHIQTHTPGRIPLNGWSACRKGRYLHNTYKRRKNIHDSAAFDPTVPVTALPQTCYALDRTITGTGTSMRKVLINNKLLCKVLW